MSVCKTHRSLCRYMYIYLFVFGLTNTRLPGDFGSVAKMNIGFI